MIGFALLRKERFARSRSVSLCFSLLKSLSGVRKRSSETREIFMRKSVRGGVGKNISRGREKCTKEE